MRSRKLLTIGALLLAVVICWYWWHNRQLRDLPRKPPRVLRLIPEDGFERWHLGINRIRISNLSAGAVSNLVISLHLGHGDLLVLGPIPAPYSTEPGRFVTWIWEYADAHSTTVYHTNFRSFGKGNKLLRVPIYHWVAPFDNPTTMKHASFYCDGEYIGRGHSGFETMRHMIFDFPGSLVYVLGSDYDKDGRSLSPDASPFTGRLLDFIDSCKANGTTPVLLEPL